MEIDFVVPWVDGSDPAWRAEKEKYDSGAGQDMREVRFRDWDLMRYWFRGVEKYAPWVRRVHFITWGHLPPWLNAENPRLHIVRHEDYIPGEYLPTFSSRPIELNIHRIDGLSEHFVYFNDDMFLIRPVREADFFRGGLPLDSFGLGIIHAQGLNGTFAHVCLNNTAVVNRRLGMKKCRGRAVWKWLSPANGWRSLFKTLALVGWPYFSGFQTPHLATAYEKKTFEEVWAAEPKALAATCRRRFRTNGDLSHFAMRSWRLAKGEFRPARPLGHAFFLHGENAGLNAARAIQGQKDRMICLNDDASGFDFETEKRRVTQAFEAILPEKCSFEK